MIKNVHRIELTFRYRESNPLNDELEWIVLYTRVKITYGLSGSSNLLGS